ncbi:MAG: hypothetical protein H7328_09325 [Bdellovibrio sp.]|nr:hypothetical protein [Bdellovibrio sp.]
MKTIALLTLLTVQLTSLFTPAFAKGGSSDGGANAVNGVLLDLYQDHKIARTSAKTMIESSQILKAFFEKTEAMTYNFNFFVRSEKTWLLVNDINLDGHILCKNANITKASAKIVGCQNEKYVFINKDWYDTAKSNSQAGVILHEILVGMAQTSLLYDNSEKKAEAELTIQLFVADAIFDRFEYGTLKDILGYVSPNATLLTKSEAKTLRIEMLSAIKSLCILNDSLATDYSQSKKLTVLKQLNRGLSVLASESAFVRQNYELNLVSALSGGEDSLIAGKYDHSVAKFCAQLPN